MKRKSLLIYSLILGGIVTTGAASCSDIVQPEMYDLKFYCNSEGGTVSSSRPQGYIFEDTVASFTVTPNSGYYTESVSINGEEQTPGKSVYTFTPVAGVNTINVTFKEVEPDSFTVEIIETENGTVEVDKNYGEVGELVNLTITPDEGYAISAVLINGLDHGIKATYFYPEAGENTVEVEFIPIDEQPRYTIEIDYEGSGSVSADKLSGYVGETVYLDIVPNDGNEISKIIINDYEQSLSTIAFDPIEGVNTVFVEFIPYDSSINKGLDFTGFEYPNKTDFLNDDEFYDLVLDKIEPYMPDLNREATKEWFDSLDFYKSFAVKYGFTKDSVDKNFRYLLNEDLVNLFKNPKKSGFTQDDVKVITSFLYNAVNSLTLEEFAGVIGFTSYALIVNANTNNDPTKLVNYENHETFVGAQNTSLSAEAKTYLNGLLDNSTFDYEETKANYLKFTDVIAEVIYRPFKGLIDIYSEDELASLGYKVLGTFTDLTDQGDDYKAKDTDYLELTQFISNLFDKNFFSKASFFYIGSTLSNLKDPIAEFMKVVPNAKGLVYFGGLTDALSLFDKDSETLFYFIKAIGRMATNVTQNVINNILLAAADFTLKQEEKSAIIFTYIAQLFNKALVACDHSGSDVTSLFKNSEDLISRIKEIANSGYITNTIESAFNVSQLVSDLVDASKVSDPYSLSDSEVVRYYNSYARLMNLFTRGEKVNKSFAVGVNTYFKVGEEINLEVRDKDNKDITSETKVEGFDTSTIGYKLMELTFPDGSRYFKSYYVTNSGSYVEIPDISATLNGTSPNVNVVLYDDEHTNGVIKSINDFENSGFNLTEAGTHYGYLKNAEGDYFFFDYIVK